MAVLFALGWLCTSVAIAGAARAGDLAVTYADDVALLYLDSTLVTGIAGVHPRRDAPVVNELLPAGDHCLTLFYADLYRTEAQLFLAIETPDVGLSAASESPADIRASSASCTTPVASLAGPAGVQYSALMHGIAGGS
jgi:hypothetical protein